MSFHFENPSITFCIFQELFARKRAIQFADFDSFSKQIIDVARDDKLSDLATMFADSLDIKNEGQIFFNVAKPAILYENQIYYISNKDLTFANLNSYFYVNKCIFLLVINGDAGEMFHGEYPGYTFDLRFRELNHNVPHIHVDYKHSENGSFRIEDGEMFKGGSMHRKEAKFVKNVILEHKEKLLRAWYLSKSGINQDLNLALGNKYIDFGNEI